MVAQFVAVHQRCQITHLRTEASFGAFSLSAFALREFEDRP